MRANAEIFLLQGTNLVDVCKNRLAEAILANFHNIFSWNIKYNVLDSLHCRYNEFNRYIQCRYEEG